jgi:hypothetical protein
MSNFSRIDHVASFLALVGMSVSVTAQTPSSPQQVQSCRHFAQAFYTWYVPFTQKALNGPAFNVVLRSKAAAFSPELFGALRFDSEAQARAKGEIVGIDFDPFVGGQDPADHYTVRQVTIRGNRCFTEVWRDSPTDTTEKSQKPDAVAELDLREGHWEFVNFHYPAVDADLTSTLALLRKDRKAPR